MTFGNEHQENQILAGRKIYFLVRMRKILIKYIEIPIYLSSTCTNVLSILVYFVRSKIDTLATKA